MVAKSKYEIKRLEKHETKDTKTCDTCNKVKPLFEFGVSPNGRKMAQPNCFDCQRAKDYKKRYSITIKDYEELLEQQDRKCAICGSTKTGDKSKIFFSIDHNHKTGKVRGLLCVHCNHGLGGFKDNPEFLASAIAYILKQKDK